MLFLALTVLAPSTRAQDTVVETGETVRRYTVEIIVFRYVDDVFSGSEVFPPDPAPPPADDALPDDPNSAAAIATDITALVAPGAVEDPEEADPEGVTDEALEERQPSAGAVMLLRDEYSMLDAARKLELLDVYEPMLHVGWTQPAPGETESVPLEVAYFGPPPPGLEGTFTLYLGRYLHLVVDLALEADPASEELSETAAAVAADEPLFVFGDGRPQYEGDGTGELQTERIHYRIHEDRIMKSGDVRYFDHPKFGVIAKVTRMETPTADDSLAPLPGITR